MRNMNWNKAILKALARLRASDMEDSESSENTENICSAASPKAVKPWETDVMISKQADRSEGGGAIAGSGLPVVVLLSAILCILLCALSDNAVFTVTVLALLLAKTAILPSGKLKRVMGALPLPCIFTLLIMLPAVFLGSPKTMLTVTMKVAAAVLVLALMGTEVSFQKLTEAFRQLHVPDIFVLVLDLTLRYLVILGRYSDALLEAVTMRSVGKVRWKDSGAGGILGSTFLKSQQMAQQTEEAMRMRGFDGSYRSLTENRFGMKDICRIAADILLVIFFAYTQKS